MGRMHVRVAGAFAVLVSMNIAARGAAIVDFKPLPASPDLTFPEFVFDGSPTPSFSAGLGSVGNSDGTLPLVSQTPGGLIVETPFVVTGIAGSQFTSDSTIFFDCTLTLSGLAASGPAVSTGGVLSQPLGSGSFSIVSTDPDGAGLLTPTPLLTGTITNSSFIVGIGDTAGELNAGGITYTGGAILPHLVSSGAAVSGNSMSISMADVTPNLTIGSNGFLSSFSANGTGLFNAVIPEPASATLVLAALGVTAVRRRQRR